MVYTLGYEGMSREAFLALLRHLGVTMLVDVRELPLSRKPGFSKTPLSEGLRYAGIAYSHVRELGCPKDVRDEYRRSGDWSRYVRGFTAHLRTQRRAVDALVAAIEGETACLMCYEADYRLCHRSLVAKALEDRGSLRVVHADDTVKNRRGRAVAA